VNSRDSRVVVGVAVGASSDRRTSGASRMRMTSWVEGTEG
jgi:hypothetical protein